MVVENMHLKLSLDQASSHALVTRAVKKALSEFDCRADTVKPYAQGGLGVIFTIQDLNNEEILLKVPSYGRRRHDEHWLLEHGLAKEAAILKELNCVAVPALIKSDETGKYLFREFAVGQRLADFHKNNHSADNSIKNTVTALFIAARQLFKAFHEHEKGCFVIRDFKPVNLILSKNEVSIKLVDVGGTRPENDMLSKTSRPHRVGSGKWRHWAPEQLLENIECLDRRADYFSLGSTVYFVLTGRSPYKNLELDRDKVLVTYQNEYSFLLQEFDNLANTIDLSPKVVDFTRRCLSPIPYERPCILPNWLGYESI